MEGLVLLESSSFIVKTGKADYMRSAGSWADVF